jgi:hypothetical protein
VPSASFNCPAGPQSPIQISLRDEWHTEIHVLGIFYARKHDPTSGDTLHSLRPGFNAQAGVRVLLFQHLSFFSEWKFNYTRFHFDQSEHLAGSNAKYNAHHLVGGIAYHF